VIAETTDLPPRLAKMVGHRRSGAATCCPSFRKPIYDVLVRGYGLVDSPKVKTATGQDRQSDRGAGRRTRRRPPNLLIHRSTGLRWPRCRRQANYTAPAVAATEINREACHPACSSCASFKTDGCFHCHAVGGKARRAPSRKRLGKFSNGYEAWTRRIQSGQASKDMVETIERFGTERGLKILGDLRPTGLQPASCRPSSRRVRKALERNVVITVWDWSGPKDLTSTTRSPPTSASHGQSQWPRSMGRPRTERGDFIPILDPVTHTATTVKLPVRDPKTPSASSTAMFAASPYWGDEKLWTPQTIPHSLMLG